MDDGGGGAGGLVAEPELTPLEQEVLDEYERLAANMKQVRPDPGGEGSSSVLCCCCCCFCR